MTQWSELDTVVKLYVEYLSLHKVPITKHLVVFACGTIIETSLDDPEFLSFAEDYEAEYPKHRLKDNNFSEILADNRKRWTSYSTSQYIGLISRAYDKLTSDGYIGPSGNGAKTVSDLIFADRATTKSFRVKFVFRDPSIYNLTIASKVETANNDAREFRRLDFMFPRVSYVITPDYKIIQV
jgi:hypothetical protein